MRRGSRGPASPPENSCFEILCFLVCCRCCFSCAVRSRYTMCYLPKAVNSTALMSDFVCHSSSLNKKNHYCSTTRKTCARFSFVSFSPFSLLFLVFFLTFHVLEQQVCDWRFCQWCCPCSWWWGWWPPAETGAVCVDGDREGGTARAVVNFELARENMMVVIICVDGDRERCKNKAITWCSVLRPMSATSTRSMRIRAS